MFTTLFLADPSCSFTFRSTNLVCRIAVGVRRAFAEFGLANTAVATERASLSRLSLEQAQVIFDHPRVQLLALLAFSLLRTRPWRRIWCVLGVGSRHRAFSKARFPWCRAQCCDERGLDEVQFWF